MNRTFLLVLPVALLLFTGVAPAGSMEANVIKQSEPFGNDVAPAMDEEIACLEPAIATTRAGSFKKSHDNGLVGASITHEALRAIDNLARAAQALGTGEKNAKAAKILDQNRPQDDRHAGGDLAAMTAHASLPFGEQVGLPVVHVAVLSPRWKRFTPPSSRNGTWQDDVFGRPRDHRRPAR